MEFFLTHAGAIGWGLLAVVFVAVVRLAAREESRRP